MTRKGLGAGLAQAGAFGGRSSVADMVSAQAQPSSKMALSLIDPPLRNPRGLYSAAPITPESVQELVQSIRSKGVLQPLLVRPVGERYQVVMGERRYTAARLAELTEVPVVIQKLSDHEAFEVALIENTQREELALVDVALCAFEITALRTGRAMSEMPALFLALKNGTQQDEWELGNLLQTLMGSRGSSFSSFAQVYSRYLLMSSAELEALRLSQISDAAARQLTRLPSGDARTALLQQAITKGLTAADVQRLVGDLLTQSVQRSRFQETILQARRALPAVARLSGEDAVRAEALLSQLLDLTTKK